MAYTRRLHPSRWKAINAKIDFKLTISFSVAPLLPSSRLERKEIKVRRFIRFGVRESSKKGAHMEGNGAKLSSIITDPHEILLFSVCIKSTIVVFKMTKQLSEENGGGPFCQRGNYQG